MLNIIAWTLIIVFGLLYIICFIGPIATVKEESKNMIQILERYRLYLNISGYKRILDVGMSVLPDFYLSKDHFLSGKGAVLDGLYGDSAIFSDGLYDNVYRNYVDCTEEYDVALLWGEWNYIS